MNIYFHIAENSGVGYYRQFLPALALRKKGINARINDFKWGEGDHAEINEKVFFDTCNWADIIVIGRHDRPEYYAKWGAAREYFNVPIVLDTDDNVHFVPITNPGYQGYYPGAEARKWNEYAMRKVVDAITVTTQDLKDFYLQWHPKIYILPNSLDIKKWDKQKRVKHEEIRIGFICSSAHADGFSIILPAVYDILKKYKNVYFYSPKMYSRVFNTAPLEVRDQLKYIDWFPLKKWPKGLTELSLDIGLAPLKDNYFNRSKSNLRYLEYSLAGYASVVSPTKPYLCVEEERTGFFARDRKEWYDKIEKLILDEKLRQKIATNAKEYVINNFSMEKNIDLWYSTYTEIHDRFHDFYGPKKHFEEIEKGKYKRVF